MTEQSVNAQGVASASLAAVSWIADLELWLQIGATAGAIVVAITASMWNIEKWKASRAERLRATEESDT